MLSVYYTFTFHMNSTKKFSFFTDDDGGDDEDVKMKL